MNGNNIKDIVDRNRVTSVIVRGVYGLYSGILRKKDNWYLQKYLKNNNDFYYDGDILFSIIVPTYNTPTIYFKEMIDSVLNQTYTKWELILVDDASTEKDFLRIAERYSERDDRIKLIKLNTNHHIAGATNVGISNASGDFIALFDHDDILHKNALSYVAKCATENKKIKFIYTDEAKILNGVYCDAFLKPDWNFDFLRSVNYITHFAVIKKELVDKYGGERGDFNGAQDWEFFLRLTRNLKNEEIFHIPEILYFWRIHSNSTASRLNSKPYVLKSQKNLLLEDLKIRNIENREIVNKSGIWYTKPTDKYQIVWKNNTEATITYKGTTLILSKSNKKYYDNHIYRMINECLRDDVNEVFSVKRWKNNIINLNSILTVDQSELINKLSRLALSRVIYDKSSYNVHIIKYYDVLVYKTKPSKQGKRIFLPIME